MQRCDVQMIAMNAMGFSCKVGTNESTSRPNRTNLTPSSVHFSLETLIKRRIQGGVFPVAIPAV